MPSGQGDAKKGEAAPITSISGTSQDPPQEPEEPKEPKAEVCSADRPESARRAQDAKPQNVSRLFVLTRAPILDL